MQKPENKELTADTDEKKAGPTIVDSRLFDANGNIREDVVETRDEESETEVITPEALHRKMQDAMEQVDVSFQQISQEINTELGRVRNALSSLTIRLNTIEEVLTSPDLSKDRQGIGSDTLTLDRLKEIAKDIVLPALKKEGEEMQKQMQERYSRFQTMVQGGMSPEDAAKKLEEDDSKTVAAEETAEGSNLIILK